MSKFLQVSVILSIVVLLSGITPAFAQNTVLTTSTALPGGGTGTDNVVVGPGNTYPSATSANSNVFIGRDAGLAITSGNQNVFTGYKAGLSNTNGSNNSFTGFWAGFYNTAGNYNSFTGSQAGVINTSGSKNSFTGYQAGYSNITGNGNSFTGYQAGANSTYGSYNSYTGYQTGVSNTTGSYNTFTGYLAGYQITSGSSNVFTGHESGFKNYSGEENTFTGPHTGYNNTSGGYNVFTGSWAGQNNTTGGYNTFTGPYTGQNITTGSQNTFLGYGADGTGDNKHTLQRATALGYNAVVAVDDGLVLGNANVKVGIGTSSPDQRLTIKGNINFVAYDNSLRLKNRPFLHFNEHESLALGLGSEIAPGAEKTLVLGSKETTVQIPGIMHRDLPHAGQFLTVDDQGNVRLSQPRVQVASIADWSDKVFEPGYALRPLGEVESFVKKNKHLPGVPSAEMMVAEGMESAAFNAKLLEKIEELTLYVIELEKGNVAQQQQIDELRAMVLDLKK